MTSDVDFHARQADADADPYITAVLNRWPPESDSDPDRSSLWRGALAVTIAGTLAILCDLAWRMSFFGGSSSRRRSSDSNAGPLQAVLLVAAVLVDSKPPVRQLPITSTHARSLAP